MRIAKLPFEVIYHGYAIKACKRNFLVYYHARFVKVNRIIIDLLIIIF